MANRSDRRLTPRLILASAMTLTGLAVTTVAKERTEPRAPDAQALSELAYSGVLLAAGGTLGVAVLRARRAATRD